MHKDFIQVPVIAQAVIKQDGKYLLIQEGKPEVYGLWNFPGGKVDVGEPLEQAATREAFEESGLNVEILQRIGIFQDTASEAPKHSFEAKIIGGELNFPKGEILDARWFTYEEISSMKNKLRHHNVIDAIEILEKQST